MILLAVFLKVQLPKEEKLVSTKLAVAHVKRGDFKSD